LGGDQQRLAFQRVKAIVQINTILGSHCRNKGGKVYGGNPIPLNGASVAAASSWFADVQVRIGGAPKR
jgi:hypothetical protein